MTQPKFFKLDKENEENGKNYGRSICVALIAVPAMADYNTPLPNNLPNWCVTEIFIGLK